MYTMIDRRVVVSDITTICGDCNGNGCSGCNNTGSITIVED